MSYDPTQVAFVDTETTGLDPVRDPIWQVAVIVDEVEHVWQQKLPVERYAPGTPDPFFMWPEDSWVLENTTIRATYDHASALQPYESIDRFSDLVRGRHLIGACPWFDSERLHRLHLNTRTAGESRLHSWHYHLIDVETLMVGALTGRRHALTQGLFSQMELPWRSREMSLLVGVDPQQFGSAHDALNDARWAKACFEAVVGGPI